MEKVYVLFSQTSRHPKVVKNGVEKNVYTLIMHLAPAKLSGYEVCPMRSPGCTEACLNTAGFKYKDKHGRDKKLQARINRTKLYFEDRPEFLRRMVQEIAKGKRFAEKRGYLFGVRLNGTSDIPFENVPVKVDVPTYPSLYPKSMTMKNVMEAFPEVQFYDYTKRWNRKDLPPNYHLTFSRAEDNDARARLALKNGMNVAVVFRDVLPATFWDHPVVDGDLSDWRPGDNDNHDGPVIVGLRAKGKAKHDKSGFVI